MLAWCTFAQHTLALLLLRCCVQSLHIYFSRFCEIFSFLNPRFVVAAFIQLFLFFFVSQAFLREFDQNFFWPDLLIVLQARASDCYQSHVTDRPIAHVDEKTKGNHEQNNSLELIPSSELHVFFLFTVLLRTDNHFSVIFREFNVFTRWR